MTRLDSNSMSTKYDKCATLKLRETFRRWEVNQMAEMITFVKTILSGIAVHYICKWLDGRK